MSAPAPSAGPAPGHGPDTALVLGALTLGAAALALRGAAGARGPAPKPAIARAPRTDGQASDAQASRMLHASAGLLAASVLADSTLEHYRGRFRNPGMFTPLLTASLTLAAALQGARHASRTRAGARQRRDRIFLTALAAGAAGTAFHVYDLARRPGGISWGNLFYAAPLGAPAALSLAGLLGLAASRTSAPVLGLDPARALCGLAAAGLAGTSSEAALFHFRGAYHNPAMWLPVTLPPVAATLLAGAAIAPDRAPRRLARWWVGLTGLLGIGGVALHANGIARRMGGWRNWSQNIQSGPPLPAPPAFSALALAGWTALACLPPPPTPGGAA